MSLRLIRGNAGRIFALLLLAAFLCALTVASSQRLHEKLHQVGSRHECAVTLLASGNYEQAAAPQVMPKVQIVPISPALPQYFQLVIAAVPSFILEHAPPVAL